MTFTTRLILLGLTAFASGVANAQIDTSILKSGNTWVYERREENRNAGSIQSGFTGTIRLTIDSLAVVGDTVKFRVTRRDSGQALVVAVGTDPTSITTQTTLYAFHAGAYSPSVPLFATSHTFAPNSFAMVEYGGDTVRYKHLTTGGGCLNAAIINLEGVGLVEDSETWGGCGNTSGVDRYLLMSWNGRTFTRDSVHAVALRALPARKTATVHRLRLDGYRPRVDHRGASFDLKGQRIVVESRTGGTPQARP